MIVDTASTAAQLLAPHLAGREGEGVAVLHLGEGGELLETGLPASVEAGLPVRDIVAAALRAGSVGLIVGRSRERGSGDPGERERAEARQLAEAASAVGIRLVDHLIFAGDECRSFRELKLL
ncbi:MAG TPA: JAB domain-containing protein [Allosphingosinicella sp.]|jgi:DNA repair protein RadC